MSDKKLIDYLPPAIRQQGFMQAIERFLDTLATPKGQVWGFGVVILILASFNFLQNLNDPDKPFWDESYYVTSAERYYEGVESYASHPPLGFIFMAAGKHILNDNKGINTHIAALVKKTKAEDLPKGYRFYGIRAPSAIMAIIGAVLFYVILLQVLNDSFMAFVFSLFYVFENAFIIHFRAAHLDGYQLTFVLAGICVWLSLFLRTSKRPYFGYMWFGIWIGLSFMVKVNSSVVLGLGGISLLRDLWTNRAKLKYDFSAFKDNLWACIAKGVIMVASFVTIILLVFTLNTVLTAQKPDITHEAGMRDWALTGPDYKAYLEHKTGLTPQAWWQSISNYSTYMKNDFTGVTKNEPNGQSVATWAIVTKPISYRWDSDGITTSYMTFIGNQVSWRLGLLGLIAALIMVCIRRFPHPKWQETADQKNDHDLLEALGAMYLIFMGVHAFLGTQRVMYVYHYFIGLSLSYIILALVCKIAFDRIKIIGEQKLNILTLISILVLLSFGFYAPFSYHRPLTYQQCQWRNWPVEIIGCNKPNPTKTAH